MVYRRHWFKGSKDFKLSGSFSLEYSWSYRSDWTAYFIPIWLQGWDGSTITHAQAVWKSQTQSKVLFVEFPIGMHMDTWFVGGDWYWQIIQCFLVRELPKNWRKWRRIKRWLEIKCGKQWNCQNWNACIIWPKHQDLCTLFFLGYQFMFSSLCILNHSRWNS